MDMHMDRLARSVGRATAAEQRARLHRDRSVTERRACQWPNSRPIGSPAGRPENAGKRRSDERAKSKPGCMYLREPKKRAPFKLH